MSSKPNTTRASMATKLGFGVAVIALGAAAFAAFKPASTSDLFAACAAGPVGGEIGGPLNLVDVNGQAVTEQDVFTKPTFVYFGYTFCPDVCPLDFARNAAATDILGDQGVDTQALFITIDPARDTPEVLKDYVPLFGDRTIALTGSLENIQAASKAYKTYYRKQDNNDPNFYLMDHSTFTYLMLPGHGFADFFKSEETPEQVAERAACFISAAQG